MGLSSKEIVIRKLALADLRITNYNNNMCAPDRRKEYVFISYKSDNWREVFGDIVVPIVESEGLRVYADKAFDDRQENWFSQMKANIYDCAGVMMFLSEPYIHSYATFLELLYAVYYDKPIIPIFLSENLDSLKNLPQDERKMDIPEHDRRALLEVITFIRNSKESTRGRLATLAKSCFMIEDDVANNTLTTYRLGEAFLNYINSGHENSKFNSSKNHVFSIATTIHSISDAVFDRNERYKVNSIAYIRNLRPTIAYSQVCSLFPWIFDKKNSLAIGSKEEAILLNNRPLSWQQYLHLLDAFVVSLTSKEENTQNTLLAGFEHNKISYMNLTFLYTIEYGIDTFLYKLSRGADRQQLLDMLSELSELIEEIDSLSKSSAMTNLYKDYMSQKHLQEFVENLKGISEINKQIAEIQKMDAEAISEPLLRTRSFLWQNRIKTSIENIAKLPGFYCYADGAANVPTHIRKYTVLHNETDIVNGDEAVAVFHELLTGYLPELRQQYPTVQRFVHSLLTSSAFTNGKDLLHASAWFWSDAIQMISATLLLLEEKYDFTYVSSDWIYSDRFKALLHYSYVVDSSEEGYLDDTPIPVGELRTVLQRLFEEIDIHGTTAVDIFPDVSSDQYVSQKDFLKETYRIAQIANEDVTRSIADLSQIEKKVIRFGYSSDTVTDMTYMDAASYIIGFVQLLSGATNEGSEYLAEFITISEMLIAQSQEDFGKIGCTRGLEIIHHIMAYFRDGSFAEAASSEALDRYLQLNMGLLQAPGMFTHQNHRLKYMAQSMNEITGVSFEQCLVEIFSVFLKQLITKYEDSAEVGMYAALSQVLGLASEEDDNATAILKLKDELDRIGKKVGITASLKEAMEKKNVHPIGNPYDEIAEAAFDIAEKIKKDQAQFPAMDVLYPDPQQIEELLVQCYYKFD